MEKLLKKITKQILTVKPLKTKYYWVNIVVIFIFGSSISYFSYVDGQNAAKIIFALNIVVCFTLFVIFSILKSTTRLSDVVGAVNYDYDTLLSKEVWMLENKAGTKARLYKYKKLIALENVTIIHEYFWGEGKAPGIEDFNIKNHEIQPPRKLGSRYVLPIKLDRLYQKGEIIEISYERKVFDSFTKDEEWVEILIMTNTGKSIMIDR